MNSTRTIITRLFIGLLLLLFIGGPMAWSWFQYIECRDMDFSVFYCIKHAL